MPRTAVTLPSNMTVTVMYHCWLCQDTICFYIVSSFPLITDHTVPKKDYTERCCFSSQLLCLCFSCTTFNCYDVSCIYCINLSKTKKHSKNYVRINIMQWVWIFFKCGIGTSEKRKCFPVSAVAGVFAAWEKKKKKKKCFESQPIFFFDLLILARRPRLYWQLHRSTRRVIIQH